MSAIPDAPDNSRQKVYITFVVGQLNDVTNAKLSFMQLTQIDWKMFRHKNIKNSIYIRKFPLLILSRAVKRIQNCGITCVFKKDSPRNQNGCGIYVKVLKTQNSCRW